MARVNSRSPAAGAMPAGAIVARLPQASAYGTARVDLIPEAAPIAEYGADLNGWPRSERVRYARLNLAPIT